MQGNLIGINVGGTTAIPNNRGGVILLTAANNNTIGGTAGGARNVISGNGSGGILLNNFSIGNVIQGNYTGVDVTGTPLGNQVAGISLNNQSNNTTICGLAPGDNVIANTIGGPGVLIGVDQGGVGVVQTPISATGSSPMQPSVSTSRPVTCRESLRMMQQLRQKSV